jgi:hypothetical protein
MNDPYADEDLYGDAPAPPQLNFFFDGTVQQAIHRCREQSKQLMVFVCDTNDEKNDDLVQRFGENTRAQKYIEENTVAIK